MKELMDRLALAAECATGAEAQNARDALAALERAEALAGAVAEYRLLYESDDPVLLDEKETRGRAFAALTAYREASHG